MLLVEACSGFKDEINLKTEIDDDNSNTSDSTIETDENINERLEKPNPSDSDSNLGEVKRKQYIFFDIYFYYLLVK
jgi:hypothetical protein